MMFWAQPVTAVVVRVGRVGAEVLGAHDHGGAAGDQPAAAGGGGGGRQKNVGVGDTEGEGREGAAAEDLHACARARARVLLLAFLHSGLHVTVFPSKETCLMTNKTYLYVYIRTYSQGLFSIHNISTHIHTHAFASIVAKLKATFIEYK